jgi:hypothetical protein
VRPEASRHWGLRLGAVLVGGTVVVLAVVIAIRTVAHADEPVYGLPTIAVVTVFVAAALTICGALVLVFSRQPVVALLSALITFLFLGGFLAILSIGIVLLVVAVAMLVVLSRRHPRSEDRAAVLSGVVLGVGLIPLLVVGLKPPIVECSDHSVRTNSQAWWGGSTGNGSGSGTLRPNGDASGTLTMGSQTYSYTCRDGRLATFTKD